MILEASFPRRCEDHVRGELIRVALFVGTLCGAPAFGAEPNISDGIVKIGALLDMSGPYSDITGEGSATAIRMAVEDFGGTVLGKPIQVVIADHQNKPDLAATKAREWFEREQVDALMDVAASAPALAVLEIARQKNRIVIFNGPAATRLTNENCSPVSVHYTFDTYALAHGTGKTIVEQGGDTWFFITVDYAFGQSLEKDTRDVIEAMGGKVLGSVRHPLNTADFSSYLLRAQASGAKVIGLANAGADTINAIKEANEFGIMQSGKQNLAGLLVYINDVHSLGLKTAHDFMLTEAFYWDRNDETRAWAQRFHARMKSMPNMVQAGQYSATLHYLQAVQAAGTDDTAAVIQKMKATPIHDFFAAHGHIREDGRMVHDMYLFQVKKPEESTQPWDYYKLKAVIPADQAFQPLSKSTCPLVRK
jgi:branched-chain amino acid transport system substrate-binding protein